LLSLSRALAFLMPFGAGWLADRAGPRPTIAAYLVLNCLATVALGLAGPGSVALAVLVQPMLAVTFFPAAFSILSSLYPPEERAVAVSLLVPFGMFSGLGAGPVLLGLMGDLGRFGLGFTVVGALLACGLLVLPWLRAADAPSGT
jgi:NNP family nitrate/nitrite transporter-like MFS transporter